jgi:hypothetical protein
LQEGVFAPITDPYLSNLGNVDEIIVLKDGQIAERGTFRELNRLGGLFSSFLAEQNRYNLERSVSGSVLRPRAMQMDENSDDLLTIRRPRPTAPAQNVRLVVEVDGKKVNEYQLDQEQPLVRIGQSVINDIVVPSRSVSRMHARLRFNNGTWLIEDTESLNGLMYQGDRVEQLPLMNGDRVQLAPKVAVQYVPA